MTCAHFRDAALAAQMAATPEDRRFADFLAAFGVTVVETHPNGKRTGKISDTSFRTMSGLVISIFLERCVLL